MQHGFILVYPQGFKNNWNDCRASASYPAKAQNIDDLAFFSQMNDYFKQHFDVDATRRYLAGFSNGGHFGFRLALEKPNQFNAIAAISANLPEEQNLDCLKSHRPVSMLLMNGNKDPISPFQGGQVTLFGWGNRGQVKSSLDSARYFATLAGYTGSGASRKASQSNQILWQLTSWEAENKAHIAHYTIYNGGHGIPNPHYAGPRLLGQNSLKVNGPELIWHFFQQTATAD